MGQRLVIVSLPLPQLSLMQHGMTVGACLVSQYLFGLQEAIPQDNLDHLITSMLRQVGRVTEKHGGHMRYY